MKKEMPEMTGYVQAGNYYSMKIEMPKAVITLYPWGKQTDMLIALTKKPNWFHRKMMTWCFGFYWEEVKP
jgi:hypothetical protein